MKYKKSSFVIVLFGGLLLAGQLSLAQVRLPQLIADGMVLQRDARLKIWGWASAGEKISIQFRGKSYKTITGADGKWMLTLPAMKAGGPYTMDIRASNHLMLHDILIGDVWFCAGQSNMVINMERVKERYPEDIRTAEYPQIRNFFVPTAADVTRLHDDLPPGKWMAATPANVLGFGAASYFFARKIYLQFHVPIGIINSSVGGTPVEAWTSAEKLKQFPEYTERLKNFQDSAYIRRVMSASFEKASVATGKGPKNGPEENPDAGMNGPIRWYNPEYVPEQGWHHFWLPGYWADQGVRGLNGVLWFRKEINLPAGVSGSGARLFLGRIVDVDVVYINGIFVGSTSYQYPPRRYIVPVGVLKPGRNIIVVRVVNNTGKGGFVPDKNYQLIAGETVVDLRGDWQYKVGQVFDPSKNPPPSTRLVMQNEPSGLYNTMVVPVTNFAVKGVLWYQGEANTFNPAAYRYLLPALIADWRKQWHQPDLPFLYAQLPNFMEVQYLPSESQWAELRQAQLKTLSVPHTGMSVNIDAGEWNDIHPLNKKDVGERLALLAQKIAYADQKIVSSGPLYQSAVVEENLITISFSNTGSGLFAKGGGELMQFAVAGADRKFVWAHARIQGDQVKVWSEDIKQPLYVRYAWADNPEGANLYNKEGLPASPFSTED
ncbi:sialate O-acetylesterase [Pedobacter westerhofensis]|uniref:Sialate O-acetylesterase n=1 Tax=Pedobacter westerhofensis TaxID=425512 RepID=A0A521F4M8_9SPHI|nr:sialate O-acetylesterase [Pedobacter westerhofensis]SMO91167.1 sialate O-acetylesterase [Pedobacter westerhofensis]